MRFAMTHGPVVQSNPEILGGEPVFAGTLLAMKLGITAGCKVLCIDMPAEHRGLLEPVPDGVTFTRRAGTCVGLAHVFVTERGRLEKELTSLRWKLRPETPVWLSRCVQ